MKLLFLTNFYPPHVLGGWEQNCQEIVDNLRSRGHTCYVLTSRFGVRGHVEREEGVDRSLHLDTDIYYYWPLDFFLRRSWREQANRQALFRALDVNRPDVVYIWGMWNLSYRVAYWAEKRMPGRVAYAVANYWLAEPDAHETYWMNPSQRHWTKVLMAPVRYLALRALARERKAYRLKLEQVACVSHYVRQKLAEAGALPHDARVIYNGIDPRPFLDEAAVTRPPHSGMHLIYIGGLLHHKGVHTAIEALGLLRQRGEIEGLKLTLVGGGHPDYEANLRQRVSELGLDDEVIFYGRVPRDQIPSVLCNSDVFLFTSIWEEPIARTVMEAMAAGLAVIGTGVGGQREMLEDGVNALVFSPEDYEALANCIVRLARDPSLRVRLAEAGQHMVLSRFSMDRMVNEIETWLEDIIK